MILEYSHTDVRGVLSTSGPCLAPSRAISPHLATSRHTSRAISPHISPHLATSRHISPSRHRGRPRGDGRCMWRPRTPASAVSPRRPPARGRRISNIGIPIFILFYVFGCLRRRPSTKLEFAAFLSYDSRVPRVCARTTVLVQVHEARVRLALPLLAPRVAVLVDVGALGRAEAA